ncbi:MAG TPA: hypothetical protein VLV86_24395, partial [Vicinamibacterales bacterium]|nr:hypothetical protein [Vicinamibacterales bacterium]
MSGVTAALRDGILAAQAREFDRARALLQQVTAESPNDPVGWFWLAIASPSAADAIPSLRHVLELDSAHDQARSALTKLLQSEAHRLAASGARADARELAAEASRLTPDAQAVWLALAALTDDQKERLDALRQALKIAPDDVALRTKLRQALLARGVMPATDRAEARACFREAAQLNADDPRVWQALAKLADTPAESVDALRQLLRIAPDTPNAPLALRNALAAEARALSEDHRSEEAYKRWREAIELTGGDAEAWLGVANTTTNQEEAGRAIETAYKLNPSNADAIAAMRRLQASKIDPTKVAAPVDAFARFGEDEGDAALDGLAALDTDSTFAQLDASLDAFASFPAATAPVEAVAAPSEPPIIPVESVTPQLQSEPWSELEVETPAPVTAAAAPPAEVTPELPIVPAAPVILVSPVIVDVPELVATAPIAPPAETVLTPESPA